IDQGGVNDDILLTRLDLLKKLHDIKSSDARDYMQKAKIQWAIEGDENSIFFHGVINRKRANLAIKGVMVDGEWVDDPCRVKEEFRLHFANRFRAPAANRCKLNYTFPNRLSSDQLDMLESPISRDEVRNAMWGCGENKSPGPDGFTFEFFRKFWDTLGSDFCAAVKWFFDHSSFSRGSRFNHPSTTRFKLSGPFHNRLSSAQMEDLDCAVSRDEIRRAVWSCGENKSSGPDGYTFEFFRKYWRFIGPDFCVAVEHFFVTGLFPRGCNSSFIALIPKVTDAKFVTDFRPISLIGCIYKVITKVLSFRLVSVISDLVSETKRKQAMFFKVDFAKAYDSVSASMASILVNGSPTSKFQFFRRLKQGDPLAPYLFILIMESLHISFSRAVNDCFFKGIRLHGSVTISHLFYADDAMFVGEWSDSNLLNIVNVLNCFFLASGLKINIQKSQLLGVGVPNNVVQQAANLIGCGFLRCPFRYLGVMIGNKMSRKSAWDSTIQKLQSKLSKWKVKTLSIGGRLTLLKSVLGASPLYYLSIFKVPKGVLKIMESLRSNFFNGVASSDRKITWVAWDNILASKKNRGLGVSSYYALNRALLLKWVWRFISCDGSLWFKVVQAIYGLRLELHMLNISSNFCFILREHASFRGSPGTGVEGQQWSDLSSLVASVSLSVSKDRWLCDLSSDGEFKVKVVRNYLDDLLLPSQNAPMRWVKSTRLSSIISGLISDVQTAFLPNRQILDDPFIINELLSWCKHKKQQAMVFKVDFAKAYDSIRWDFLEDVLRAFGFGSKWCSWIRGCLHSGMASVLLNGSPTSEFQFHCGLKQGDPLAPYLFILIMKSLHLSLSRAIEAGIFKGIKIGSSLNISHLFYADDAVFIGEWSIANLSGITHILHCFSLLSGLSINLKKSHLLGVGIRSEDVNAAALYFGCSTMKTPFKYLGVMVGGNSSTFQAWDDTIGKLKARLSNWKLKTLSVGGRLTLLKSVLGSTPIYNMSIYKVPKSVLQTMESIRRNFFNGVQCDERKIVWIKWAKVLASKKYGGLGVSSFYALNRALLFKWVWRFISRDNSLWCRLIMSMHGSSLYKLSPFRYSTWKSIIREVHMLKDRGVDLISHCHIRVGNGLRTQFWNEVWIGDTQLRVMFPRIYALEINKDCTVADKLQFSVTSSLRRSVRGGVESSQLALLQTYIEGTLLSNMEDRWVWDLNGEGVFRVKDVRILLDECFLPKAPTATRWVKYVPIKINVFAWKVFLDRLPTRSNLQHRGVLVSDLLCPLCSSAQEDSSHLFFSCRLATDIVRLVCRWWNLSWTPFGSYVDWLNWFNSIRLSSKVKDLLEGVLYITWWSVWMFRNQLLFSSKAPRKDVIFDDIVSRSFTWCISRCNCTFSWDSWLQHPYLISL
ncbi:RNA-directed DNA polymerase, eukaryota, partial [Tanacetum coccineum]